MVIVPQTLAEVGYEDHATPNARLLTKEEEFTHAMTLGLFDYMSKSWSRGFVVSLSGGAQQFCALLDDKSVWCWGSNEVKHICPDKNRRKITTPCMAPMAGQVRGVTTGRDVTCLLLEDKTVRCYGDQYLGARSRGAPLGRRGPESRQGQIASIRQVARATRRRAGSPRRHRRGCVVRRTEPPRGSRCRAGRSARR